MLQDQIDRVMPGWTVARKLGEGSYGGVYQLTRTLPNGKREDAALKTLSVPRDNEEIRVLQAQSFSAERISAYFRSQVKKLVNEYLFMQQLSACPNVVSCQDTDVTPTGLGAYASRQTYVAGFSIRKTGLLLKEKILAYAQKVTRQATYNMDIVDGNIVRRQDGAVLMSLSELAMTAQYNAADSEHITAESTYTIRNNAYSFGCTFADVEVDIALCKVKLNKIINVHDCGSLINPALAEAQVHGGMSMAIGYGMSEQLLFDEKTGKPLNNNLLDYKLSTFMDHPHLEAQFVENPEPTSPFGTKALGEPPACSGAPAIRNAILNATGVAIDCTPITPHVLFAEFSKAGLIQDSWNEKEGK